MKRLLWGDSARRPLGKDEPFQRPLEDQAFSGGQRGERRAPPGQGLRAGVYASLLSLFSGTRGSVSERGGELPQLSGVQRSFGRGWGVPGDQTVGAWRSKIRKDVGWVEGWVGLSQDRNGHRGVPR